MRSTLTHVCFALLISVPAAVAFDYDAASRQLIRNGVQAVLTCNGLFTSERTLEQVFAQELAYLGKHIVGSVDAGNYRVDHALRWVEVGGG